MKKIIVILVLGIALACGAYFVRSYFVQASEPFPESFSDREFPSDTMRERCAAEVERNKVSEECDYYREFSARYVKIYGTTLQQADGTVGSRNGKALIYQLSENSYQIGFYAPDEEEKTYTIMAKPVTLTNVELPYASEYMAFGVPCVSANSLDGKTTTYLFVHLGKVQQAVM